MDREESLIYQLDLIVTDTFTSYNPPTLINLFCLHFAIDNMVNLKNNTVTDYYEAYHNELAGHAEYMIFLPLVNYSTAFWIQLSTTSETKTEAKQNKNTKKNKGNQLSLIKSK